MTASSFASLLFFSVLLVANCGPEGKTPPTSSSAHSSADSKDIIAVMLSLLESRSSSLPKEFLKNLSFLHKLPPDVQKQVMVTYLSGFLRQLNKRGGGGGGEEIDPGKLLNIVNGLMQGLKGHIERFSAIAPTIRKILERIEEGGLHRNTTGDDPEVEKDMLTIRKGSFCQRLDDVCYADRPFHY